MNNLINLLNLIHLIMTLAIVIVAAASAAYEVLSRAIPTSKTWSIIGNILKILTKISEALDNKIK